MSHRTCWCRCAPAAAAGGLQQQMPSRQTMSIAPTVHAMVWRPPRGHSAACRCPKLLRVLPPQAFRVAGWPVAGADLGHP